MAADSHNFHRTHDTRNQEPGFPSEIPVIFSNLQFLRIWKLMVCIYRNIYTHIHICIYMYVDIYICK